VLLSMKLILDVVSGTQEIHTKIFMDGKIAISLFTTDRTASHCKHYSAP
jgi:hypothetical protein